MPMSTASHLLPEPSSPREHVHARSIELQAFRRSDGRLDLEAVLLDVKPYDVVTALRRYPAGVPIHLMAVRLTVDASLQVVDASAAVARAPFAGVCNGVESTVVRLIGANLMKGFRQIVAERIGPVERCSHLSEMLCLLPTLAVQALVPKLPAADASVPRPAQLDRCRGWRADGDAVRVAYPTWHRKAGEQDNC